MYPAKAFSALVLLVLSTPSLAQIRRMPTANCISAVDSQGLPKHINITHTQSSADLSFALMGAIQSGLQQSNVYLEADINEGGHPTAVSMANPSKYKELNAALIKHVRSMEFEPGICSKVQIPIILQPDPQQVPGLQTETREQAQARTDIYQAYIASSMSGFSTNIDVVYNAAGEVTSAKLEQSTGNPALNRSLISWAKKQKFPPGSGGSAKLPYEIKSRQQ